VNRRTTTALAAVGTAFALSAFVAVPGNATAGPPAGQPRYRQHDSSYEIGLFGDMPYGDYGRAHYPAVIADMNRHRLAFSIFDGDNKNGSEPCYADPHPEPG
jgi:hypothetical protein